MNANGEIHVQRDVAYSKTHPNRYLLIGGDFLGSAGYYRKSARYYEKVPDKSNRVPDITKKVPDNEQGQRIYKYALENGFITIAETAEFLVAPELFY